MQHWRAHILGTADEAAAKPVIYADTWDDYCEQCRTEAQRRRDSAGYD